MDGAVIRRPDAGSRGSTLVDALVTLSMLGLAGAALTGLLLSSSRAGRSAAFAGRRAELAQRAIDHTRSGLSTADSGVVVGWPGGEGFEAVFVRRDTVAPGALEVRVRPLDGGVELVLEAARPVP